MKDWWIYLGTFLLSFKSRFVTDTLAKFGITDYSAHAGYKSLKKLCSIAFVFLNTLLTLLAIKYIIVASKKGWLGDDAQKKVTLILFLFLVMTALDKALKEGKIKVKEQKRLAYPRF